MFARLLLLLALLPVSFVAAQSVVESPARMEYRLGAGDKIRLTVFKHEDLSGEYTVDGSGQFSMPLIGSVNAEGRTVTDLETHVVERLKPDYLRNPRVTIQVLNYRPFYIIGEVNSPSSYPFVEGMTYLNAVAIAGGFTHRARDSYVMVKHIHSGDDEETRRELDELVQPGDIIRVRERRF